MSEHYYRNEFYFCGIYWCVNSGESLTNSVKPESFTNWVCEWLARVNHINKIHKNNNSLLIIPTLSSKSYFCRHYCTLGARGRKIVLKFPLMEFICVKRFLQPIKLCEINIMSSWNYDNRPLCRLLKKGMRIKGFLQTGVQILRIFWSWDQN